MRPEQIGIIFPQSKVEAELKKVMARRNCGRARKVGLRPSPRLSRRDVERMHFRARLNLWSGYRWGES